MTTTLAIPVAMSPRLRLRMLAARLMAFVAGDTEATHLAGRRFDEITATQGKLIASICLSFSRTREEFEDLRQDALINIWNGLARFRAESAASTWVYRVTLNTCVSYKRRSRVSERSAEAFEEFYRGLYDDSAEEEQERYLLMHRLIASLRPVDRSIMLLWLNDRKYDEIADIMGLSREAVAARIKRAKDAMASKAAGMQK
ncbi:MAG: sigma-70 family RNA polymerase sigma factor [Candidatus Amulumruptor sp.]|nr:sigma-70 family RNA polymerase sigma factor [Candidatus Amulumruptor sp.]MDE7237066.1 sigma-70 family RNA polymerase sigma factor [Paramuribaculum sp.]